MREFAIGLFMIVGASIASAEQIEIREDQSWSFANAPHSDARIVIGTIEYLWDEKDPVIGVGIVNLHSSRGKKIGETIHHMPFAKSALVPYLVALDAQPLPLPSAYKDGYATWKVAVDNEEAGVFTVAPSHAIDFVINTVLEGN